MQKIGNNTYLKDFNRKKILNLVRLNKTISKIELASRTGLSPTAVGKIVKNLTEEGYIIERFEGESSGGRKPMMLSLREGSYYSLGIDIEPRQIRFMVINLSGEKIYEAEVKNTLNNEFVIIKDFIKEKTAIIFNELDIKNKILGIGISVPGLINQNKDIILAPNLPWDNVPYKEFYDIFNGDIDIVNESKASAIYESFMGACTEDKNFICLNIGSGIGAGIYIDGKLYLGSGGMAGEIGHIQIEDEGKICGCGKYGCLETIASSKSIKKELYANGFNENDMDIEKISEHGHDGNELVLGILKESGKYIGKAISYLVNIFNPTKIIIGKDFSLYGELIIDEIREIVEKKIVKSLKDGLEIKVSKNGEFSSVHGAALIPLKRLMGLI